MAYDNIEKLDKLQKIDKSLKPEGPEGQANQDHFEALMNQQTAKVDSEATTKQPNSLLDEVREANRSADHVSRSSSSDLVVQTQDIIAQIDTIKHKLETPNLDLKGPVQTILKSKLEHIDENLKIAINKAGGEYTPAEKPAGLMQPIDRFLGMLSHGQNQLETLGSDVQKLQAMGKQLTPSDMLLIQIKVGRIQQEIELFTSMLNKALESTKTIMNVQI